MAFLAPIQSSRDHVAVVIKHRSWKSDVPVFVVCSANGWLPEEMNCVGSSGNDNLFEKTFKVSRSTGTILYKFRVGDGGWVWDSNAPTEYDGFTGMNNRFDVPSDLPPSPPPESLIHGNDALERHDGDAPLDAELVTALPSPAHTPRELDEESGTELEAPSVSDWEPEDRMSQADHQSEPEVLPDRGSPSPSTSTGAYSMSETAEWILL